MKTLLRSFAASTLSLSVFAVLSSACTVNANNDAADAGPQTLPDGAVVQPTLPFVPSNVSALAGHDLSLVTDLVVNQDCSISSDDESSSCGSVSPTTWLDRQSDGSQIRVFAYKSINVQQTAHMKIGGSLPVVLLSIGDVEIDGQVSAGGDGAGTGPGGFSSPGEFKKGGGPGGGPPGVVGTYIPAGDSIGGVSAGGGSFCGLGGKGSKEVDPSNSSPAPLPPAAAYGTASLIPLLAGSSGGGGGLSGGGGGGGAVQIIAGGKFKVGALGFVNVGGGSGLGAGELGQQQASGAGSGGAILVEAMSAEIAGALAANGGSGASDNGDGQNGTPDANPAGGAKSKGVVSGGSGSAATDLNGGDGIQAADGSAGAGGAGAGWIRINTQSGVATITGVVSPSVTTTCATQGKVVLASGSDAGAVSDSDAGH